MNIHECSRILRVHLAFFNVECPNMGFRPYKINLKYAISALKSDSYFCYSLFSKWHENIKFLEFEENKPKEGFLKRSSFLVMRTVYFFTSLQCRRTRVQFSATVFPLCNAYYAWIDNGYSWIQMDIHYSFYPSPQKHFKTFYEVHLAFFNVECPNMGFRPYKINLKYAISALKSDSYFCYSLFSKWLNKPKEGFLKRSSFLVMRTVYFFTSLARCLFPCVQTPGVIPTCVGIALGGYKSLGWALNVEKRQVELHINSTAISTLKFLELIFYFAVVGCACLIMVGSNFVIISVILKRSRNRQKMTNKSKMSDDQRRRKHIAIHKNLVSTVIMATAFLVTNLPYGYVVLLYGLPNTAQPDVRIKLYCTQSVFASLLINPWLYPLRMETIRKFFPCFQINTDGRSTLRSRFNQTGTVLLSLVTMSRSAIPSKDNAQPISEPREDRADSQISRLTEIPGPSTPCSLRDQDQATVPMISCSVYLKKLHVFVHKNYGRRTLVLTDSLSKFKADSISKNGLFISTSPPCVDFLDIDQNIIRIYFDNTRTLVLTDSLSKFKADSISKNGLFISTSPPCVDFLDIESLACSNTSKLKVQQTLVSGLTAEISSSLRMADSISNVDLFRYRVRHF
eukprot:sb/3463028/